MIHCGSGTNDCQTQHLSIASPTSSHHTADNVKIKNAEQKHI